LKQLLCRCALQRAHFTGQPDPRRNETMPSYWQYGEQNCGAVGGHSGKQTPRVHRLTAGCMEAGIRGCLRGKTWGFNTYDTELKVTS